MSLFSAFCGETYTTLGAPPGQALVARRSSAQRKAARVLPLPVGAVASTCSPAAIRGQHAAWTAVGAP